MEWIDSAAAAERLGVKPATLYAYVSRGVLHRRHSSDGQRSLFDPAEIEALARRGRPRRRRDAAELSIESTLTALGRDRPYYRGRDAIELAGSASFESVAEWLWSADVVDEPEPWQASAAGVEVARAAQSALPATVLPIDRLHIIVTTLAATDPVRFRLDAPAVVAVGRALVAGMVDALPAVGPVVDASDASDASVDTVDSAPSGASVASVARRLWPKLCPGPARPELLAALDAALVLLADHELAASTLAARVAASVRADPYGVVVAGLGVLGGPVHGGASLGAQRLLAQIRGPADAARVIGEYTRRGERIPGIGHAVYKAGDARGSHLLDLLRAAVPGHDRMAVTDAVLAELRARKLPAPNIDLALAAFGAVTEMIMGGGEVIFAVARTAGWLAHALEEYARGTPLRPRAVYTGPPVPT